MKDAKVLLKAYLPSLLFMLCSAAHSAESVIEEVIVTANKRAESLQEISSAVSAYSGDTMEALNLQDFYDIADMTPGMAQRTEDEITIRGVGRIGGDASFASTVAVHENGFFLPRGVYWPFVDIAAVEVTRGPAGSVFGRNATGGAINVKWRQPGDTFGGWLDASSGNYSYHRVRGAVDIPLSDDGSLLTRIAFLEQQRDGTIDNELTGDKLDGHNKDEWLVRGTLAWQPAENIEADLRIMHWQRNGHLNYGRPSEHTRTSGFYEAVGAERPPPENDKVVSNVLEFSDGDASNNTDTRFDLDFRWLLGNNSWFGDIELAGVVGRHNNERRRVSDLDASTVDIVSANQPVDGFTNNAEIRFSTTGDNGFDFMLGVFWAEFFEDGTGATVRAILPVDAGDVLLPGVLPINLATTVRADLTHLKSELGGESLGLFSNATLRLQEMIHTLPNIEVFFGYRKNSDDVTIDSALQTDVYIPHNLPLAAQSGVSVVNLNDAFDEDTWDAGLKWHLADDHMAYLKRAKGYKAGAVEFAGGELNRVAPEILHSWELGWKSSYFDRRLQANLAVFNYDYSDLQVLVHVGIETSTENAANSEMNGAELELMWAPNAAFFTQLSLAYVSAEFTDYCTTDPTFPQGYTDSACEGIAGERNMSGNQVPNAVPWSAAVVAGYTFDLGDFGTLQPLVKVVWIDAYYTAANNIDPYLLETSHQTDLRLSWRSAADRWSAELFVEHLENDRERFVYPIAVGIKDALFYTTQVPPRMLGLQLGYRF
ncbi:MAG: iron complex outermembrane receptor protein [Bermanella sp.]|jgi:iron complex outermembrane receptor protein